MKKTSTDTEARVRLQQCEVQVYDLEGRLVATHEFFFRTTEELHGLILQFALTRQYEHVADQAAKSPPKRPRKRVARGRRRGSRDRRSR